MMVEETSSLAHRLARRLKGIEGTVATVESCTGGLLASTLTDITGSSSWFERGLVTYSNESKITLCGVKPDLIERYGAVSERCALQMAEGVRRLASTDIGIATTGIAGPLGDTTCKEVGKVFVAVVTRDSFSVKSKVFEGDRIENKASFVRFALKTTLQLWDQLSENGIPIIPTNLEHSTKEGGTNLCCIQEGGKLSEEGPKGWAEVEWSEEDEED